MTFSTKKAFSIIIPVVFIAALVSVILFSFNTSKDIDEANNSTQTTRTVIPSPSTNTSWITLSENPLPDQENNTYYDSVFLKQQDQIAIKVQYEFTQPGDGDTLQLLIDDELKLSVIGNEISRTNHTQRINIEDLDLGLHYLTIKLIGYGDKNSKVIVGNLTSVVTLD